MLVFTQGYPFFGINGGFKEVFPGRALWKMKAPRKVAFFIWSFGPHILLHCALVMDFGLWSMKDLLAHERWFQGLPKLKYVEHYPFYA